MNFAVKRTDMRPFLNASALILSTAIISACGGGKEDSQVSETRMDDIDSLEGTISDDMINSDESTDEAPLDAAPAAEGKPKIKDDKSSEEKPVEKAALETEDKADAE